MNFFLSIFFSLHIFYALPHSCHGVNCKFGLAFSNNTNKIESDKSCAHDTSEYCFASICAKEPKWAGSSKWLKEWGFVRSNDAKQCAVTAKQIAADVWKDALNYCICVVGKWGAPNSNAEVTFPMELPEVSRSIHANIPTASRPALLSQRYY
uniref:Uncharacterized protein n=1 Tax=Globodera rostochiensis TaxID=31243 RepID=A0A914GQ21_GLORO